MISIDDILISDNVVEKQFVCDLSKCKGACCVEGDAGAPLLDAELKEIDACYDAVKPYLQKEGLETIAERGKYIYEEDEDYSGYATPLIGSSGACAYVTKNEKGIAVCGIEQAYDDGNISFRKPVSCHLYPIRITEYESMTAVNYESWDICDPACKLGSELKIPAYQFVKDALIRRFGKEFYEQLDGAAKYKLANE